MNRPVRWSRNALDDIKNQIDYIAGDNPRVALRIADRIRATATALGTLPTGRQGRVVGTYENRSPTCPMSLPTPSRRTSPARQS